MDRATERKLSLLVAECRLSCLAVELESEIESLRNRATLRTAQAVSRNHSGYSSGRECVVPYAGKSGGRFL